MEQITIKKEDVVTIIEGLNGAKIARNQRAKTFHYVAELSNYVTSKNYNRDFKNVGDLTGSEDAFTYEVSTEYLNQLPINTILEIKLNFRRSNAYSNTSYTYLVVVKNDEKEITFEKCDTALKAFKFAANNKFKNAA